MPKTLDKRAAAAHDGKCREHPKNRADKLARHGVHGGIIGVKQHEELLAKQDIHDHEEHRHGKRIHPRPMHHLLCALLVARADVLADHGHGGILNALRDLVDNVVNAHAHTERRAFHNAEIIDLRVDHDHGKIDKARLDCHGHALLGDHAHVFEIGNKILLCKIKAERLSFAVKIEQREDKRHALPDDGCPRSTRHTPAKPAGEKQVKHQIGHRGNGNEHKRTLGIAHTAQYGGNHVVPCRKEQTDRTDDHILHRHVTGFVGNVDQGQYRLMQQQNDAREHQRQRQHKAEQRAHNAAHFFFLTRAQRLRNQHLPCVGKAQTHHSGKIDDQRGLRHGGETKRAHKLADNDHIDGAVQHLHGIGRHKRQRKKQQLP